MCAAWDVCGVCGGEAERRESQSQRGSIFFDVFVAETAKRGHPFH